MKKMYLFLLLSGVFLFSSISYSQVMEVRQAVKSDVSIPLREMKPAKKPLLERVFGEKEENRVPNRFRKIPANYNAPQDPALQTVFPQQTDASVLVTPIVNVNGIANSANSGRVTPPDPTGDVGPNHYVQAVNCMLQMFNKSGASVYGPVMTSTIWNGFNGNWTGHNDGDAVILYDESADRWIISQFAIDCAGSPYTEYELVAVSTSPDPTGSYYRYAFQFDYMPDYPKLAVWQDGYYMAINRFNTNVGGSWVGAAACVMQRSKMLTGDPTAAMIYFKTELIGGTGAAAGADCYSMLPSDCDGTWAPAGAPNYFTYINDNTFGGPSELRIWAFHTDWSTPANSTFTFVTNLPVATYTMLGTGTGVISQQGTSNKLDGLGDRLMFRNQYRNFGTYETFVTCHNVNAGSGIAGLRWYEYRKTGTTWTLHQQSTYNPGDGKSRWLGSIAMNVNGDIGLMYTVSNATMYPSIYFTGRKAADPLNQMNIAESIIQTGAASMTGATRWGDYAALNVDPSDNATFWATNEYVGTYGGTWPWSTKIASFKFSNQPSVVTNAATAVTGTTATLNGTVNPNGIATTYNFQWGTTTSYGNTTTTTSAGAGTATLPVNAPISGLTAGTLYHFRVTAVNTEGTSYGNDMTFIPGAATVSTTPVTGITTTTANSGGNITSDGGLAITARGVCWSTSPNPVASGSHTTNGSGTGIFTSSVTGLSPNTTYYLRAYATNSSGTYYGNEISFNTLCNLFTIPFTENFPGTTLPNCWSNVDNGITGQVWQFGTITTASPNPNLTGNYAYLNSDAYGAGNSQNADLISPTLDLTGYNNVTLAFSHNFKSFTGSSGTVSYSINNGTSWTPIQSFTTTTANPASFNQVIAALSNQSQVKFKWNYTGTYGYHWAVDNISVTGTSALTLTVSPSNQNVAASAGSTTFNVTSNSSWTVVSNQSWCTVNPSGTGNGTITANFTANTTTSTRVANITVTVTGLAPVIVTVTQAGQAPTLNVAPSNQNVTAAAGSTNFTVTSNSPWTVTSNQGWCSVTPSGTGNGTIVANYSENTSTTSRVANITVTVTGVGPVVVTVTQAGAAPTLTVLPPTHNVADTAGNVTFTVTSNSSWTAVSNQSWCTVTSSGTGNGSIVATYTANATTSPRSASITVTVTGIPAVIVSVVQSGAAPFLTVTPSNQNVPANPAGSTSFSVSANVAWTAVSTETWCTVTPSGSGSGTIVASYTANTATTSRVAIINVSGTGVGTQSVTVTQNGTSATLSVAPTNQNVTSPSGSTVFNVTSNSNWTAISDANWCLVTTAGSGNGTIDANYTENTATSQRIAYITVTVAGLPNQIVTVTQSGSAPSLNVTPSDQYVDATSGFVTYSVASNSAWTVTSDSPWCIVTPSGSGPGDIVANYTENTGQNDRLANITVTVAGVAPQVVKLHQSHIVGVPAVSPGNISVVPNPTSGKFHISSDVKQLDITITDMTGRQIIKRSAKQESDLWFDLSRSAPGCYLVRILHNNGLTTHRLILDR